MLQIIVVKYISPFSFFQLNFYPNKHKQNQLKIKYTNNLQHIVLTDKKHDSCIELALPINRIFSL